MAHGRSSSWAIPVHAILSVEQTKKSLRYSLLVRLFETRVRAQAWRQSLARGRLAWCLLCGRGLFRPLTTDSLAARLAQPNVFKKETLRFLFLLHKNFLVYRPEHGRTTRRT